MMIDHTRFLNKLYFKEQDLSMGLKFIIARNELHRVEKSKGIH